MNNIIKSLNQKKNNTVISLQSELIKALREYFNLRIQSKAGQLKQLHLLKKVRRHIASIKNYLANNKKV
ncbi:50S ribosomal protein L29 [Blochmannia endosymbiont of Camponotus sp. C-003]|uniref:50S ribosomal protein L29 n=1 Tax=unclassified Candidatus Blochmanniella TaxID=711328 RepID=UPI002025B15C|nr:MULTISPECIES: 50S ribosomal protein L29 [unclassified Candidatus Blochmannia]URJ23050.1 50S ribosomal protein L29 [Blochmannia endosymbiont of Camponotus sp. C-003]URJ28518.1 50S ribosomal protein L29 [Blochmannia endosymbiont of Camponotus sp. C-046]